MRSIRFSLLIACVGAAAQLLVGTSFAAEKTAPVANRPAKPDPLKQVEDVPGLPRVLLIGDSLSIGYTLPVRKMLEGKANVHRPPLNCHSSRQVLAELDEYLGDKPWEVIHFNCGSHDYSYRTDGVGPYLPPPAGKIHVPLEEYKSNLRAIVQRLKQTKAKLIWASTTPISADHEKKGYRSQKDLLAYNAAAAEIMREEGVPIDDLYALVKPNADKFLRPNDGVHFTSKGYDLAAKAITDAIQEQLKR